MFRLSRFNKTDLNRKTDSHTFPHNLDLEIASILNRKQAFCNYRYVLCSCTRSDFCIDKFCAEFHSAKVQR